MFDPATGELKVLTTFGGYVAFQHWYLKSALVLRG